MQPQPREIQAFPRFLASMVFLGCALRDRKLFRRHLIVQSLFNAILDIRRTTADSIWHPFLFFIAPSTNCPVFRLKSAPLPHISRPPLTVAPNLHKHCQMRVEIHLHVPPRRQVLRRGHLITTSMPYRQ